MRYLLAVCENTDLDPGRRIRKALYVILIRAADMMQAPKNGPIPEVNRMIEKVVLDINRKDSPISIPSHGRPSFRYANLLLGMMVRYKCRFFGIKHPSVHSSKNHVSRDNSTSHKNQTKDKDREEAYHHR